MSLLILKLTFWCALPFALKPLLESASERLHVSLVIGSITQTSVL